MYKNIFADPLPDIKAIFQPSKITCDTRLEISHFDTY